MPTVIKYILLITWVTLLVLVEYHLENRILFYRVVATITVVVLILGAKTEKWD